MAFTGNIDNKADSATLDFWRAAEAGEVTEVEATLRRVADINARNEHGVTALMRAAQHGHDRVVRSLLAHGADANVIRNDKFTALSLAAFFGHTEVVRVLMEHGADSKAPTRHGTSAHMWATARTFNEVVDQLKEPVPPKLSEDLVTKPAAPVAPVAAATKAAGPVTSAIVRTLKDPPEIWDLVHEKPPRFNARAAFVARLKSMRLTLRIAAATGLVGACIVGVLVLRGVQARNEIRVKPQVKPPTASVNFGSEKKVVENAPAPANTSPAPQPESFAVEPVEKQVITPGSETTRTRRWKSHSRAIRSLGVESQAAEQPAATEKLQIVAISPEKAEKKVRAGVAPQYKSSSPLSPQLITPAKAKDASPKKKVIQWP